MEEENQNKIIEEKRPASSEARDITGKKFVLLVWEFIKIAIIAFIIVAPIRYFLFQPFIVKGVSMIPSLQDGNYLIIDEISYRFSNPQRGDVVVFNAGFIEKYDGQRFIKRVVGLPGETVDIVAGQVKIIKDGTTTILEEDYLPNGLTTIGEIRISLGPDQYFVLGDNRQYSYDSRAWGILPKDEIIGKASLRIFPITEMLWLK